MILETLVLFVEFVVQMAFLFAALWIMIKIQKLNYNFPGLLGSAALVSGLDRALDTVLGHFLGNYLATYISAPVTLVVLIICIAKVTRADRVDVLFTIVVGYALMFGMNLWLFGALRVICGHPPEIPENLTPSRSNRKRTKFIKLSSRQTSRFKARTNRPQPYPPMQQCKRARRNQSQWRPTFFPSKVLRETAPVRRSPFKPESGFILFRLANRP